MYREREREMYIHIYIYIIIYAYIYIYIYIYGRPLLNACSAERVFGAVFGVPGVFGSGFTAVFGSVRRQILVYALCNIIGDEYRREYIMIYNHTNTNGFPSGIIR